MISTLQLNDLTIEVTRKKMKNIRLRIYPNGQIKVSTPLKMKHEIIHDFLVSKLTWIQQTQAKFQQRETQKRQLDDKSCYVWGKRYLFNVIEQDSLPLITLTDNEMRLYIRADTTQEFRQAIIDEWLRAELKRAIPPLLEKWQPIMEVKVNKFFVQKMKTRWGSCNYTQGNVRFNSQLAKKPPECLEYVVVHELVHLLEPSHNARFYSLMSQFLSNWKLIKAELNRLS